MTGTEELSRRGDGQNLRHDVERLFFERLRLELVLDMMVWAPRPGGAGYRLAAPRQAAASLLLPLGRPEPAPEVEYGRARCRRAAWSQDPQRDVPALTPVPGFAARSGLAGTTIGFLLLEVGTEETAEIVRSIVPMQRRRRAFAPLFVTDSNDLEIFDAYGFVVERLHGRAEHEAAGNGETWDAHARRRLDLLKRKWGIGEIIPFGAGTTLLAAAPE